MGGMEASTGLLQSEQIHTHQEAQDGNLANHHQGLSSRPVDGVFGSSRCLFTCPSVAGSLDASGIVTGCHYQLRALPFGLSMTPRALTKVLVMVIVELKLADMKIPLP